MVIIQKRTAKFRLFFNIKYAYHRYMITQDLLEYIKSQRIQGVEESTIKSQLLANNWSEQDVNYAFTKINTHSLSSLGSYMHSSKLKRILIIFVLFIIGASGFYYLNNRNNATINVSRLDNCIPNNKTVSDDPDDDNPNIQSGVPIITLCFDSEPEVNKEVGVTVTVLPRLKTKTNEATISFFLSDGFSLVSGSTENIETFEKRKAVQKHIVVKMLETGVHTVRGCSEQKYPDNSGFSSKCDMVGGRVINNKIELKRLTAKEFIELNGN